MIFRPVVCTLARGDGKHAHRENGGCYCFFANIWKKSRSQARSRNDNKAIERNPMVVNYVLLSFPNCSQCTHYSFARRNKNAKVYSHELSDAAAIADANRSCDHCASESSERRMKHRQRSASWTVWISLSLSLSFGLGRVKLSLDADNTGTRHRLFIDCLRGHLFQHRGFRS